MKKLKLSNRETAEKAVEDAPNFNIKASVKEEEGEIFVEFESKASFDCEKASPEAFQSAISDLYSHLEYTMKWAREDFDYATKRFYEHMEGHLPAIKDAGKLQAAIDTLGLGDSFSVAKKTIYVEY